MRLKCFVAMALEHDETDALYDNVIKAVLQKKSITPFRVDRKEDNEDIDDMILRELHDCDFALADLTYARPSVYFEAGFAQRAVPVIYTCRKDHFQPSADDEFGNFRVHFDLLMKNIIPWSSPTDAKFSQKLERRLSYVTAPLLRTREFGNKRKEEARKFSLLSNRAKIQHLTETAIRKLRHAGFRLNNKDGVLPNHFPFSWRLRLAGTTLLTRFRKGVVCAVFIHFSPSFSNQLFKVFEDVLHGDPNLLDGQRHLYDHLLKNPKFHFRRTLKVKDVIGWRDRILLCSFQKVRLWSVSDRLVDYQPDLEKKAFERRGLGGVAGATKNTLAPRTTTFHIFDNIRSETEFVDRLGNILKAH